jgi:acetyl-CoA C-acetyltransferase
MPVEKRDPTAFAGSAAAWQRALAMAGAGLEDLDFAEVHDCFTIAELIMYEVMGLAPAGEGRRAIEEGWVYRDGKLPVNLSGGLKAKGHPVGATGVSQHVVTAVQLSGTAGEMQLAGARRAAVHNMGGLAIANYVSVLEAV